VAPLLLFFKYISLKPSSSYQSIISNPVFIAFKMKLLAVLYIVASLWFTQTSAVTWYYLRYWTPADDISFTNFSMKMVIPSLPQAATYYLWPGLQDVNTTGKAKDHLHLLHRSPSTSFSKVRSADLKSIRRLPTCPRRTIRNMVDQPRLVLLVVIPPPMGDLLIFHSDRR